MIDPTLAFGQKSLGFSIWEDGERFQCSIKMRRGGFSIGYGSTPADAWEEAMKKADLKPRRRRSAEDLA